MNSPLKIVIYGAESTGKTTLAKDLASYYNTTWVPEYSRDYLQDKFDKTGKICAYDDLWPIAQGQMELERNRLKQAKNNLLFCDTNVLQTYYYGKAYFKDFVHPGLWNLVQTTDYDFYFLTYIDMPWIPDDLRDRPDERMKMHRFFENALIANKLPYKILKGNRQSRLGKAVEKIDKILNLN